MKKVLLISPLLLFFTVSELFALIVFSPSHGNYRWRNDNGTEVTATWKASENDSVIQSNESNIRLRMEIYHTSASDTSLVGYLYYASFADTVWHQVTDDLDNAFVFASSTNLTNGAPTTGERLSKKNGSCVTQPGIVRTQSGGFTVNLSQDQRKEYEFCIKPSPNAKYDQTYAFRIEDEVVEVPSIYYTYGTAPRLHLQKPVLTVTAVDVSRPQHQENPEFSYTYSGFVDGDDESVLDQAPSIICDADTSSTPGTYDIVPYGGSDNKYEYNPVVGTLTVTQPTAIEQYNADVIKVFPNPFRDIVFIEGKILEGQTVSVADLTGRLVSKQKIENGTIDLSSLQKGIYLLKINNSVYKITKE